MRYLVHQLLEASAQRDPGRTAVVDRDRSLTYAELEAQANQVANVLIHRGVTRGDRVGLYLDKSLESVVAIYGALKAGAAYVPLDAEAPPARLAYIVEDCGIRHLLTGAEKSGSWRELAEAGTLAHLVVLNGEVEDGPVSVTGRTELDAAPSSPPAVAAVDLDLAYILYTSGSTGRPKGVMLSHLNALSFVRWAAEEFAVTAEDRLSSHAPLHFDLSVFDLFAASLTGAAVALVPRKTSTFPGELTRFIEDNAITVWYSVPSILTMMLLRGGLAEGSLPALRTLLFAGEVFPTKYVRQLMRLLPHVRFCNLYGPTETNVCTWYEVPVLADHQDEPIPIGRAIGNVEIIVVGEDGAPVPRGEVGELYVRGTTVMQGYWGDPERSAQGLIPNPWGTGPGDHLYRTGDLVQEADDGDLRFLGRRDSQIKSRGYRIELGDIETALYAHPDVVEAAVVAVADPIVTNRIHAHVVVRNGLTREALVAACLERLPSYMVPERFDFTDALPKTSTGKVDRQTLRASVPSVASAAS